MQASLQFKKDTVSPNGLVPHNSNKAKYQKSFHMVSHETSILAWKHLYLVSGTTGVKKKINKKKERKKKRRPVETSLIFFF